VVPSPQDHRLGTQANKVGLFSASRTRTDSANELYKFLKLYKGQKRHYGLRRNHYLLQKSSEACLLGKILNITEAIRVYKFDTIIAMN
jgi:hypothetical protein